MIEFLATCGLSVLLAALYRLLAVYNLQHYMTRGWVVAGLAAFLACYPLPTINACLGLFARSHAQQEALADAAGREYPAIRATMRRHVCVLWDTDAGLYRWTIYLGSAQIVMGVAIGAAIWLTSFASLKRRRA